MRQSFYLEAIALSLERLWMWKPLKKKTKSTMMTLIPKRLHLQNGLASLPFASDKGNKERKPGNEVENGISERKHFPGLTYISSEMNKFNILLKAHFYIGKQRNVF